MARADGTKLPTSWGLLAGRRDRIEPAFRSALRREAPGLSALVKPGLAAALLAALAGDGATDAEAQLDTLLLDGRSGQRAAAAIGLALVDTVAQVLGPDLDDAVRIAWNEAYLGLVRNLMAARWNRFDLVA